MFFRKIAALFGRSRTDEMKKFKELFERFQQILTNNNLVLELISELEDKLGGEYIFDINYLKDVTNRLSKAVYIVTSSLNVITDNKNRELFSRQSAINGELNRILEGKSAIQDDGPVIAYADPNSDMMELVGGKNANLSEIRNRLGLTTPDGFIITTSAFLRILDENKLWPEIRRLYQVHIEENNDIAAHDHAVEELISKARIPSGIAWEIDEQLEILQRTHPGRILLAVRSSALGEDLSGKSFAGQFVSVLGCPKDRVIANYKRVIASRFKNRVIEYAGDKIFRKDELPMAVGVQIMIDSETAGVAYSVDPSGECPDCMTVAAVAGSGEGVVGGTASADTLRISRLDSGQYEVLQAARKNDQAAESDSRDAMCLNSPQVVELAEQVLVLERYFKRPVDVEWCFGKDGKLYILQCRPLKISPKSPKRQFNRAEDLADKPVLMKELGQVAQRGIAAGVVRLVNEDDDAADFPAGAIAVTKFTTPRLTAIIRRAAAIITDIGSSSGHMATVAREFGVPTIVNTGGATSTLKDGMEVTVDAEENVVYKGIVKELLAYKAEAEDVYQDLPEYRMLRQILRRVSPLYMINPNSPDFTAGNCRTYHDIVRFSHEKAVKCLINLNISSSKFRGVETRELKLTIPLGLHIIDLGGGLIPKEEKSVLDSVDDIRSLPLHAIIKGLIAPGVWSTQPMNLGFGDLISSLTRYSTADRGAAYRGQNLAVVTDHYANISLRLGYHFNVIDTYVSENVDDNYVYFRFVGGVTETERRRMRALLLKEILEKLNFRVTLRGDLVVARLKKISNEKILEILGEIGRLIGFTRQLDTQMRNEQSIAQSLETFMKGRK